MNYPSRTTKGNLTANVDRGLKAFTELRALRAARASGGRITPSAFVGNVLRWWADQGAPAVMGAEQLIDLLAWDPKVDWQTRLAKEKDALPVIEKPVRAHAGRR